MAFKIEALLIIAAQIYATFAHPPCACARNLLPVCGSDGVTYGNECLLRCADANSATQITMAKPAECDSPAAVPGVCICTLNYAPVCGNDGQTYPNECALNCQKARFNQLLKVEHSGTCNTLPGPVGVCPLIESPVCGSDGNTYGNECMLNGAAANVPGLRITHDGPCEDRILVKDI